MAFRALENLSNMHDGYRRAFKIDARSLLLIQHAGDVHLIENRCPHMDASLSNSTISGDGKIRCPIHGIEFDLQSGSACGALAGTLSGLNFFDIVFEGKKIGVDL